MRSVRVTRHTSGTRGVLCRAPGDFLRERGTEQSRSARMPATRTQDSASRADPHSTFCSGLHYDYPRKKSCACTALRWKPRSARSCLHALLHREGLPVAKQTTVTLVDDLDGSEADEQVEFALDGKSYEIDLSSANVKRLRAALDPFINAARRAPSRRSGSSVARPTSDREQNQAVREWALGQGMKISERGRIPTNEPLPT